MVAGPFFPRKIGLNDVTVHPLHPSSLSPCYPPGSRSLVPPTWHEPLGRGGPRASSGSQRGLVVLLSHFVPLCLFVYVFVCLPGRRVTRRPSFHPVTEFQRRPKRNSGTFGRTCTLCYAIARPGRRSGFRAGFRAGELQNRPSGRPSAGRRAVFKVFPIRIRLNSGPESRFPARRH